MADAVCPFYKNKTNTQQSYQRGLNISMSNRLKTLFIQNEIKKIDNRIADYINLYELDDVKNLLLRRLILIKQREKAILEDLLKYNTND